MKDDAQYMQRCLELALHGEGLVHLNPLVGCVITEGDQIIGEGYHHRFGGAHAEVEAIRSVRDTSRLRHSTLYVNLEPCSHYGKTPPCSDLIIEQGIPRVVIGALDSNPKVAGQGVERLRNAGIEVITGIEEASSRWVNRSFFTFFEKQRPYILLKWAATEDGFLDVLRKEGTVPEIHWITDPKLRILVHRWRATTGAILVGAHTVRNDNPELTTRNWPGGNPLRVVLDPEGILSSKYKVFNSESPTWLYTRSGSGFQEKQGTVIMQVPNNPDRLPFQVIKDLHQHNIQSVTIEGGKMTLDAFIKHGLWDEARIFTGARRFENGTPAPEIRGIDIARFNPGTDILRICINPEHHTAWPH